MGNAIQKVVGIIAILCGCFAGVAYSWGSETNNLEELSSEIQNLHVKQDYRAGKCSYVVAAEIQCKLPHEFHEGDRKTLLDVRGCGSLRHIWSTHYGKDIPAYYCLEIYVDDEEQPSIVGDMKTLCKAAMKCRQSLVKVPASVPPRFSYNFYLPIPFAKSIRVEALAIQAKQTFFQLDYRIDDASMNHIRLKQKGNADNLELFYTGIADQPKSDRKEIKTVEETISLAGNTRQRLKMSGPAIIRKFSVGKPQPGSRLKIYFDGEKTAAVDVDPADFFGPFNGVVLNKGCSYFPMPFKRTCEIEIVDANADQQHQCQFKFEKVKQFADNWRYFHAKSSMTEKTNGYLPYQVLFTRGRGHWMGMSLYESGHDHGGGDYAVIDWGTPTADFLHGINGEDYFSFAWFSPGQNQPYSESVSNKTGRMRLHLENPYPFDDSIQISWAALRGVSPRSVSYWYQDDPADLTVDSSNHVGREWEVFGPCLLPLIEGTNRPDTSDADTLFAGLAVADNLDKGQSVEVSRMLYYKLQKGVYQDWAKQNAVGGHLNLSYVYRHVMDLGSASCLAYEPRCMLARTNLSCDKQQKITLKFSYDDPVQISLNGRVIYEDLNLTKEFITKTVSQTVKAGDNELLVKMADTVNTNQAWAGFFLKIFDEQGNEITK